MNTKTLVYLLLIIGILILTFFGLDDSILYAKSGIKRWTPFILIFILIPLFTYKLVEDFSLKKNTKTGLSLIPIIVFGPLLGLWCGHLSDNQLKEDGKLTTGIVSEKFKSKRNWLVKCKFQAKNRTFTTFSKTDRENLYQVGDTLTIKYSDSNPENHTIVELEN